MKMEENKYKQNRDTFTDQIRQKLENHTMPVDADLWKGIEKRIAPRKRFMPVWLYASVAVAAGLALLFSVGNFIYLRDEVIPVSGEIAQHKKEAQQFVVVPDEQEQSVNTTRDDTPVIEKQGGTKSSIKKQSESEETATPVLEKVSSIEDAEKVIAEKNAETTGKESDENMPVNEIMETKDNAQKQRKINQLSLPEENQSDWTEMIPQKDKKTSLLAALGSGVASSSVSIPGRSRAYRSEGLVNLPEKLSNVLTPNDFRDKEYLPPFSVGINSRVPLTDHLAVESSLVYTYLLTRLSGSTSGDFRAEVKLHYLGVPVNLVWSLLKEHKWEIYVSGGGMIEKGLRTDFRQYQNWDNVEVNTSANTDVEGVQWSVNGTLGVSYDLLENISLFFDPKLSYYFENDQPFSIRKELPLLVSLNTGLRMSF